MIIISYLYLSVSLVFRLFLFGAYHTMGREVAVGDAGVAQRKKVSCLPVRGYKIPLMVGFV